MNKNDLLKHVGETAYNIGFGAKKHFASYDIISKAPGIISFFSMAFGIYALVFEVLSVKFLSASFIIVGIVGLYISLHDSKKDEYETAGVELTKLYNELNKLYHNIKSTDENELVRYEQELKGIEGRYYANCKSKQILFSDWYAHYKFFWQHQIEWVDEQKQFRFFRDKIPLSFSLFVLIVSAAGILWWGIHIQNNRNQNSNAVILETQRQEEYETKKGSKRIPESAIQDFNKAKTQD